MAGAAAAAAVEEGRLVDDVEKCGGSEEVAVAVDVDADVDEDADAEEVLLEVEMLKERVEKEGDVDPLLYMKMEKTLPGVSSVGVRSKIVEP